MYGWRQAITAMSSHVSHSSRSFFCAVAAAVVVGIGIALWTQADTKDTPPALSERQAAALAALVAPPPPGSFGLSEMGLPSTDTDPDAEIALYDLPRLTGMGCVARLDRYLALAYVTFDVNAAALSEQADPLLQRIAGEVAACPTAQVLVAGHADGSGSDTLNATLSLRRAEAVRNRLAAFGVAGEALQVMALGAGAPLSQGTAEETAADRRVDFRVLHRP